MDPPTFESSIVLWQTLGSCHLESQTPQLLIRLGILHLTIKFQIIFFQDSTEVRYSVPKTHKDKRLIIVVKRNNIPTRIMVIDAACKVVLLTPTCEGRIHDKRIADATGYCLPNGSTLFQDSGFQGFSLQGINIIQPKKKPKGRDLTLEEKERNRLISSIRVRVEHVMSGIKNPSKISCATGKKGLVI